MQDLKSQDIAELTSPHTEETTIDDLISEILIDGGELAVRYLEQTVLAAMVQSLFEIRRHAMTQADLGARLGKQQPAIARLEAREPAKITLGQFWDVAVACGLLPLVPEFVPIEDVRQFLLEQPEAPLRIDAFRAWYSSKIGSNPSPGRKSPACDDGGRSAGGQQEFPHRA